MTSVFLIRGEQVLLLFRRGSRAVPDSWVGLGGHLEPEEATDPAAGALRELAEEVGITPSELSDLALRYVALRDSGTELRQTYYFTATLADGAELSACDEGQVRWFGIDAVPDDLEMPPTAQVALRHWLRVGRYDAKLRFVLIDSSGALLHVTP